MPLQINVTSAIEPTVPHPRTPFTGDVPLLVYSAQILTLVSNQVYSYVEYMDEIGCLIGVTPSTMKLLWRDPGLALRCAFGPCVPAQYRLVGPGAWDGAREAIFGVEESMALPLQTRKAATQKSPYKSHISVVIIAGSLIVSYGAIRFVW